MARVHSGLQKQVLALYRKALRVAISKGPEHRSKNLEYVRNEFRKGMEIDRKNFRTIEYEIRKAEKQIKLLSLPGVSGVTSYTPNKK